MNNGVDKVLEAEKTIETIANELSRMKSAADLLSGSQDQVEALIRASEAIVNEAGDFAENGAEIIRRLSRMDLETRLGEVTRNVSELQALLERQLDRLNEALEELEERNSEIVKQSSATLKEELAESVKTLEGSIDSHTTQLRGQIMKAIAEEREERQKLAKQLEGRASKAEDNQKYLLGLNAIALLVLLVLAVSIWL